MQLEDSEDEDGIVELNAGDTGWDDDSDEEDQALRVHDNSQYQYRGDDISDSDDDEEDMDGEPLGRVRVPGKIIILLLYHFVKNKTPFFSTRF